MAPVPRPLPIIPRGPRRKRPRRSTFLFACPRISPEWELAALSILMKPKEHTKGAIRHRPAEQPWPAGARRELDDALALVRDRLDLELAVQLPESGDYWMVAEVPAERVEEAKALAVVLSDRLPDLWFVFDGLFVRRGTFFRRERGYKLNLVEASNVHLKREVRAALPSLAEDFKREGAKDAK
jgi:hypothetical protein